MSETTFFQRTHAHSGGRHPRPRRPSEPIHRASALPAIRIPVTPANREQLKALRARELDKWEHGESPEAQGPAASLPHPRPDREAPFVFLILATTALTALVQSSLAVAAFLAQGERFRAFIESLLR